MKLNLNVVEKTEIEPGDVVIDNQGRGYLLANIEGECWKYCYINLMNGKKINGFKTLEHLNSTRNIGISVGHVVKVIKNKNIILNEQ